MEEMGNYHLILENWETGERKYLDFEGEKCFAPKEFTNKNSVSLAFIDEITTNFINEDHLRLYFKREDDLGIHKDRVMITYQYNGENMLSCVYNDDVLSHIASKAVGKNKGQINLNDTTTFDMLITLFNRIKVDRDFVNQLMNAPTGTSYTINNHNKEMIRKLRNGLMSRKLYYERDVDRFFAKQFIADSGFGSYKEFRALYLNYREYTNRKNLERARLAADVESKTLEDTLEDKKPKTQQLSMFDMIKPTYR